MKVIGVDIKSGNYQGNDYCNVMIYGTYPTSEKGFGEATQFEKVKYNKLCEILGVEQINKNVVEKRLMNKNVEFGYDRFKNVNYMTELPEGAT
jgi:hypothetical protein